MSLWDDIVSFFTGKGLSRSQAQGIAGNLYGESKFDIGAIGDNGSAYGLAQWHPDRQSKFRQIFGKSIIGSSLTDQLEFIWWELNNTEASAGIALKNTSTVDQATRVFMQMYERPANDSSLNNRLNAAYGNVGGIGGFIGNWAKGITNSITDPLGVRSGIEGLLTGAVAARFSAVVIGVILIGLAIAALVLTSDTGKTIIKTGAKVVA